MSRRVRPRALAGRPTVSVVIPCYNYGHYLPTAVGSVTRQVGVDVELIVIDDASPDGSGAVVQELAARDERIRPILHPSNRGHIATYNEGLAQARGDYVVLLSADDALPPGAFARATALFEANPSVGMVYGHPVTFSDELPPSSDRVRSWTVWPGEEWIDRVCRTGRNCIMNPEVVMRTSLQHAIGGYDPELPHSGDLEMWMRAAAVSDIGHVNGPAQGFYRFHGNSMQRTTYSGHLVDLQGLLDAFEKVLVRPGSQVARGPELFDNARRALATSALEYARTAYDQGGAGEEPVDEYMAFAVRVWPGIEQTRRWRGLIRCAAAGPGAPDRGLTATANRLATDLRWRLRSRRWRWSGV